MRMFTYHRAGAVVIDGENALLIGMQDPGGSRWYHFPGGGIEQGEDAEAAACRELFEETGLRAASCQEFLRAGIHGGQHRYFLIQCEDLALGELTGPELDYAAGQDFRAEWIPIADLASLPVFPRCVAERLAAGYRAAPASGEVPWLEDDRTSWDGVGSPSSAGRVRRSARAVVASAGRIAAMARERGGEHYVVLPGGGVEAGETPEDAVVREVREELGLDVVPARKLAVVVHRDRSGREALQTFFWCTLTGGELGTGDGPELTDDRRRVHGTYAPVWLDAACLPRDLKPEWLLDRIPTWVQECASPSPGEHHPERFCEFHDD